MKKRISLILWLLVIIFVLITISVFSKTLALFEDNAFAIANNDIGRWIIKISGQNITDGESEDIVIDSFIYEPDPHVSSGVIAPGGSAYFELVFDATDCDVAVKYDISFLFDEMDYADNITFEVVNSDENVIRTGVNTYSGIIDLDSILDGETSTIRVNITWDDVAAHDEDDTNLGIVSGNTLNIPLNVNAIQYLGETLVPYVEPVQGEGNERE